MFSTKLPAGNHVIQSVRFHAPSCSSLLTLCCGLLAHMTLADTKLYTPVPGDYYIVTDHGTASVIKKAVFEGATKPQADIRDVFKVASAKLAKQIDGDVLRTAMSEASSWADVVRMVVSAATSANETMSQANAAYEGMAKPETLGMREENGYVGKMFKVTTESGRNGVGVIVKATGIDEQSGKKEGANTMPQKAVETLLAGHKAEVDKLQNVIKSLTAQNEKKQTIINEQRKMFDKRTDLHRQLNKLIDTCAAANLI